MISSPHFSFEDGILTLSGILTTETVGEIELEFSLLTDKEIKVVDGVKVERIDSSGAVLVNRAAPLAEYRNFNPQGVKLLNLSRFQPEISSSVTSSTPLTLEKIGAQPLRWIDNAIYLLTLVSDILYWGIVSIFDRSHYRKGSFIEQAYQMGSTALPIVATILFLIGGISALQSASTLKAFGASILVADLLALGLARELAPLMAAIIVSGRSGSAIASEIATMKFTEELDAIKTMGINPLRFVVAPKLWAMVVTLPLLSLMALFFGLAGGLLVAVTHMDLSFNIFYQRILVSLFFWDIVTGLIKSVSFAVIITVVGVYKGVTFTGGADGVGRATTSSVVTSIFVIIVMDAIWGIVFYLR